MGGLERGTPVVAVAKSNLYKFPNIYTVNAESYDTFDTALPYLKPEPHVVPLATDQLHQRQRRAAPADVQPPPVSNSQYQSVNSNASVAAVAAGAGAAVVTTVDSKATAAAGGSVSYNVHNVGVNGTGQRKDVEGGAAAPGLSPAINYKKPTQLMAAQSNGYPKKVAPSSAAAAIPQTPSSSTAAPIDVDVSGVDIPDDDIESNVKNESLVRSEDFHDYYNSVLYVSAEEAKALWSQLKNTPENQMLSSSHRRAMTVELNFDFPFYGHYVRNITVATGGFLYTGEYVHSWLAATQYIAPLMANFDTSISNDSFVRVQDNGTAFTAVWENVTLQDKPEFGKFTFSVTLHQSGDIVFGYFRVPTLINSIQDHQHPVKVGLSDAYIIDKHLYFARRKTIYEYHRVSVQQQEITNSTIIKLTAQPTCLGYNDCQSCLNHNTTFTCLWCPALSRCSTGTDRKKHEWMTKGCETAALRNATTCPALGEKGNNAAAQEKNGAGTPGGSSTNGAGNATNPSTAATGSPMATEPTVISTRAPQANAGQSKSENAAIAGGGIGDGGHTDGKVGGNAELSQAGADNKSVGVAFGFMVPICLVFAVTLWLFYAYRNPHTKSGQLLIQFRPSQWSWRRGEARYTAATIHM
nr:plexin domain-containing protein 2 isoform X2 [Drosophila kikkawai]